MQIRDQAFWQGQRAEIVQSNDGDGEMFLAFLELWCDKAEHTMAAFGDDSCPPIDALRESLIDVEEELGALPPRWTAHMLLVILGCWVHGDRPLLESMTSLERHMVVDEVILTNGELQESAT